MASLTYVAPQTVSEAVAILAAATGPARLMAGGTDLVVQMRAGRAKPETVVDAKRIPGMIGITDLGGGAFTIGAATPGIVIGRHEALRAAWPGVVEAANLIGSKQVQARASLGGNLCNASPAADSVPPLIAAGATVRIAGPAGERTALVESIVIGPGRTSLTPGELVVSFHLPAQAPHTGDAYLRFIPRTEMDIAVVGCGICVTLDAAGVCTAARVCLGAVGPTQIVVPEAAAALVGHKLDDATLAALDAAARAACRPIDDKRGTKEFRIKIAGVLARRAAAIAFARAGAK
jgi:CO/xanthine dehydrogenase FAD-binding subunit